MLRQLHIENVAVIESATVDFSEGLNVFTGETGAGKSILIDSLGAVLGLRTSKDLVRTGEKKAFVRGCFETDHPAVKAFLQENHLPIEDLLVCTREIYADGRNVCRIGNVQVNVSTLKALGAYLVDIHGQQETQKLADPEIHMDFVDAYGGLAPDLEAYEKPFAAMVRILRMIRSLSLSEQEKEQRIRDLKEEIDLLEKSDLHPGEKEELQKKRALYYSQEQLVEAAERILSSLEGDEENAGIPELLQTSLIPAEKLEQAYDNLKGFSAYLSEQAENLIEWRRILRSLADGAELSPQAAERMEQRLDLYDRLEKKYGGQEMLFARLDQAYEELESIRLSEDQIREKKSEYNLLAPQVKQLAEDLSEKRKKAAADLCAEIEAELTFLNMPAIRLEMHHEQGKLTPKGADRMELLLSANAGEDPKPLAKIASGGELARVMLAIKRVLFRCEQEICQVFDEIDTGISGNAARKVGIRMKEMGKERQVICVTHLAQIASFADNHLLIEKTARDGRTYTIVRRLDEPGREMELARIISGSEATESALETAREMRRQVEEME